MAMMQVHELVKQDKLSPEDGAYILQLRRELASSREKQSRREVPGARVAGLVAALLTIVAAAFGIRRQD